MRLIQNNTSKVYLTIILLITLIIFNNMGCIALLDSSKKDEINNLLPRETELYTWRLLQINELSKITDIKNIKLTRYKPARISIAKYQHIDDSNIYMEIKLFEFENILQSYSYFSKIRYNFKNKIYDDINLSITPDSSTAFINNYLIIVNTNFNDIEKLVLNIYKIIHNKFEIIEKLPDYFYVVSDDKKLTDIVYDIEGVSYLGDVIVKEIKYNIDEYKIFYKHYNSTIDADKKVKDLINNDKFSIIDSTDKIIIFKKINNHNMVILQYKNWIIAIDDIDLLKLGKTILLDQIEKLKSEKK